MGADRSNRQLRTCVHKTVLQPVILSLLNEGPAICYQHEAVTKKLGPIGVANESREVKEQNYLDIQGMYSIPCNIHIDPQPSRPKQQDSTSPMGDGDQF